MASLREIKPARWAGLWLGLALAHLVTVVVGSFFGEKLPTPLAIYGFYTGSAANLKFFAPGVGSQLRVSYEGETPLGVALEGGLLTGRGETDLRIEKIVESFWKEQTPEPLRRALAASWAGKILSNHPELTSVTIKLDSFDLPGRRAYAAGARPRWRPYYYGSFSKGEASP